MVKMKRKIAEELTQVELFRRVSDICEVVNMVVDPHELLEVSLKQTMRLFGAKRGSIFVLKDNGKDLTLEAAFGMNLGEEKKLTKRMGEGVVGQVAETKQPIVVDDIARDARFRNYKSNSQYKTSSFICAPLLIKDQLIGVINITEKDTGSRFRKTELTLLDFLATQIALNYRRVKLYQKFKDIAKESRVLREQLGKSSEEASHLKRQVVLHEKLATIGKLAGGIAHEFNNPLDGVIRYTNLCLEHVKDDVVRGYLLEIKQGLKRMANIVKSLLACSRSIEPTVARININETVEQAIDSLQTELVHKRIKLKKYLANELPMVIDYGFERVVSNLLRNAIDAVKEEGQIEILTFLDTATDVIVFKIIDSGCGIKENEIHKLFEPFYTTKDIDKGCGLGLTIVNEIVKSYNGTIAVESSKNKGAIFIVHIPTR